MTESTLRIVRAIRAIPKGKVSSYGAIALAAGSLNDVMQVVRVLHSLSEKLDLPWHRVIRSNGSIALKEGKRKKLQIELLRAEGVEVSPDGLIDMSRFKAYT